MDIINEVKKYSALKRLESLNEQYSTFRQCMQNCKQKHNLSIGKNLLRPFVSKDLMVKCNKFCTNKAYPK